MYLGNESLKWAARLGLTYLNKTLLYFMDIRQLKSLNAKYYLKREINLWNPQKLNEKILTLAYTTDTTLWSRMADKYEVRSYVKERGLEDILVPLYGVYDSCNQIDFEALPQKFVLKATHGCDMNFICKDKSAIDHRRLQNRLNFWLRHNMAYMSLEPHYACIPARVLCEKYLETQGEIIDYKFFCCDGKARFVEICTERSKGPYLDLMTLDWSPIPGSIVGAQNNPGGVEKPAGFDRMIEIADTLADGLPFVRVDLYEVDGHVYFGEMTFTPATGVLFHFSDAFLLEQGKYITLPNA